MATYTVVGSRLVCTGTDITSAGIKSAIDSNPSVGTATEIVSSNNSRATYIFNAEISIGDNNTASLWNPQNEFIQIIADQFIINGNNAELRTGELDTNSKAENVCTFCYASSNGNYDRFKLQNGANLTIYGGFFAVTGVNSSRGRIQPSANSTVVIQDADLEIEDGIGTAGGSSLSGHTINYKGCRFHHTAAVGVKLYNPTSATLEKVKIESCNYAIQPGATPLVLRDLEIDSCNFHIVPNVSNSDMTFINPDFLTLRAAFSNSSDITRIAFRYDFKVIDSSGSAVSGAEVYITDQTGSVIVNTVTDANGLVNSSLPTYDGTVCLQNSTFAGNTKTNREDHARSVYKYGFLPKTDTITIDQDTKDFVALLPDANVTESNKTTVDAYTEIDTSAKFYDRANSYLEDNFGTYLDFIVTRSGNLIELGGKALVINATASAVFAYSNPTITIKASTYTGGATATTGSVTTQNGALLSGGTFDCDVNYQSGAGTTLTNVTVTSGNSIDFNTAGTYTLSGCTIDEVTNSSGGAITLNLTNGSSVTTNTGPSITINEVRDISITGIIAGSRLQIYNVTTATEVYNDVVAGTSYSATYNEGGDFTSGDTVRIRLAYVSGVTAKECYEANAVAGASGWSALVSQVDDSVYNANAIDGSTVTEFSADYPNVQVDIADGDGETTIQRLYAWYKYNETTSQGISDLFCGLTADDEFNYVVATSILNLTLDNTSASPVKVSGAYIRRDDDATIIAATSNSIQLDPSKAYIARDFDAIGDAVWQEKLVGESNPNGSAGEILENLPKIIARKSDL